MTRSKPIALPDCTPDCAKKGRRLLELFPSVARAERFAFWHRTVKRPAFFRGLCYQIICDAEAMQYDAPPMVRLALTVSNRLLGQLLRRPIMAQVDQITLKPSDGYEDQLLALLEWPALKNLDAVAIC